MPAKPYCILLTGMPNSGKSTIAYELVQRFLRNVLVIDGDRHREAQFLGEKLGFDRNDIIRNTEHVIKLAQFAQEQGFNVLIPQITPYVEQRRKMRASLNGFLEVFCSCNDKERTKRPNFRETELEYEFSMPDLMIHTDRCDVDECIEEILGCL